MTNPDRLNPSLSAIFTGLKPVKQQPNVRCCHPEPFWMPDDYTHGNGHKAKVRPCSSPGRDYFLFPSGSIRRQVGQGHSAAERNARRVARRLIKQSVGVLAGVAEIAAAIISKDYSLPGPWPVRA